MPMHAMPNSDTSTSDELTMFATASTCTGSTANSSAAKNAAQRLVARASSHQRPSVVAMWMAIAYKWKGHGLPPPKFHSSAYMNCATGR